MNLPLKLDHLYAQKCGGAVLIYKIDGPVAYGRRIAQGCERCIPRMGMAWIASKGAYAGEEPDPDFHRHLVREIEP